mgnify:CR=1 FL=1|tara:strand:+ start:1536 stop:2156 length:621 start_codon:yes stop_codon:yes gene_type:complete
MKKVGVIDYGTGNLCSVVKAFEFIGANVSLIRTPNESSNIDALVFPGQGTFDQCMASLVKTGLDTFIQRWIEDGKPYFGICLGLQVLFAQSEEGNRRGLGILEGRVKRFSMNSECKIPHMGWNSVNWNDNLMDGLMTGIEKGDKFYFVHSYHVSDVKSTLSILSTSYEYEFISGVKFENSIATQFHPEKSQEKGLKLYRNFLEKMI